MDYIFSHFLEFIIVVLFLSLFFKESLTSFINSKLGVKDKTPQWAENLQLYFNHDTTSHHNKTHEKLDKLQETTADTNRILKEIKEYGITCRE